MSDRRIFFLWFNHHEHRYQRHDYGLHCGDGLQARIDGAWVQTRIEHSSHSTHSHGWYIVTHPEQPLENLPVRKDER